MSLLEKIATSPLGSRLLGRRQFSDEELAEQLSQAKLELAETILQLQQTQGDLERLKQRLQTAQEDAYQRGRQELLQQLLPYFNDIWLAFQERPSDLAGHPWAVGIKHVSKRLEQTLAQLGQFYAYGKPGQPFDPRWHEAISVEVRPDLAEGTVVQVLQPGYVLGKRVLQYARVTVSRCEPT